MGVKAHVTFIQIQMFMPCFFFTKSGHIFLAPWPYLYGSSHSNYSQLSLLQTPSELGVSVLNRESP